MTVEQKNGYVVRDRRGDASPERGRSARRNLNTDATNYGLFATPRTSGQMDYYRPRPWLLSRPGAEIIDEYDWSEMLDFSRQIFAQRGNVGAAVVQKNIYAVGDGWRPHYAGRNAEWGKEAEEWLREVWYPNCDVRGGIFDFTTNLFLSGIAYDVDGDDAAILTVDDTGFPKVKHITADSIGSRGHSGEVKGGEFDGARIVNGVILDRNDGIVGLNLLGEDQKDDELMPAYNCHLNFEPEFRSLSRGIPRVGKACLDWFDVEDIDVFLKRGVKLDSAIGLMHWTESGSAPDGTDILTGRASDGGDTDVEAADIKIEKRIGGEVLYMKAGKGEKLEGLKSERPHPNSEAFVARIERRGLSTVGWSYELLNPKEIGGASIRMVQDQARHSVFSRQRSLKRRALRMVQFAVSQGMKSGRISKNHDGADFLKWMFNMPKPITVDNGYDEQADRENLKLGTTTMGAVCEKAGGWWEDFRAQTKKENINLIDAAADLVEYAKTKRQVELSFTQALDMMRQFGANERKDPTAEQGQQQQGGQ